MPRLADCMATQGEALHQTGLSDIPLTASGTPLVAALCSIPTQSATQTNSTATMSTNGSNCRPTPSSDGLHIEIPNQVKAIYLNGSTPGLGKYKEEEKRERTEAVTGYGGGGGSKYE